MILNVDLHDGELDLILRGLDALIGADMAYHRLNLLYKNIKLAEELEERITASQKLYQKIQTRIESMRGA